MSGFGRNLLAVAIAGSLCVVPTASIAATPVAAPAAPAAAAAPADPWLALSAMTTSSSAVTTAAAARHTEDHRAFPILPLILILATIAVGVWILLDDDDDKSLGISPN